MPETFDLDAFLQGKQLQPVMVGKSGAQVYFAGDRFVWKHIRRAHTGEEAVWDSCVREARMYAEFHNAVEFAPKAYQIEQTQQTVSVLLARGRMLRRDALDAPMLARIMDLLVRIHHYPPPDFLEKPKPYVPPEADLQNTWIEGWESVLAEHPGVFDQSAVQWIAQHFIEVNLAAAARPFRLVHGDFHIENLLILPDGRLAACDWQSAGIGDPAGDLSFFRSRLSGDGVALDERTLLCAYCEAAARAGYREDAQALARAIALANVNTSFAFWHAYLHGADTERVARIFEKMVGDMHMLLAH